MSDDKERRELLPHHQDKLAAIRPEILGALDIYSAESDEDLPDGFRGWDRVSFPALVFQWQGAGGESLYQVRSDDPADPEDKYLTRAGAVMPLGVHPVMRTKVADPAIPIVVVEGTKQYLAATSALEGEPWAVVGITGCEGWSHEGLAVPDFAHVPWEGRKVLICYDADLTTNRDVWEAARALTEVLGFYGVAKVGYVLLPARGTAGLDDLLLTVADRPVAMKKLLVRAGDSLGRAPAKKRKERSSLYVVPDIGLQVARLAKDLRDRHPMALALDETISMYRDGVFMIGRLVLSESVTELLGDDFRRVHLADVERYLAGRLSAEGLTLPETAPGPVANVKNGMLNLLTGELMPHDPVHLSAQQFAVEYDPGATCPRYERWLAEQVGESQIDDLEEVTSTMLDRSRTPAKAIFLFGPSRSGKSTYLRLMAAVAGKSNVSAVSLHQLSDDRFAAANVYGKVLNAAADLSAAHVNDLSIFKMLVGEDLIHANRKYGAQFSFTNTALFAFSANTVPTVGEASTAYTERVKPFEFPTSFAGFEDPGVEDAMLEELPGIFARWVRAYRRLRERRTFLPTDPVVQRMFIEASDRVRRWVSEEMTIVPVGQPGQVVAADDALTQTELLRIFNQTAERDGEVRIGLKKFGEHVRSIPAVVEVKRLPNKQAALNVVRKRDGGDESDGFFPTYPDVRVSRGEKESSATGPLREKPSLLSPERGSEEWKSTPASSINGVTRPPAGPRSGLESPDTTPHVPAAGDVSLQVRRPFSQSPTGNPCTIPASRVTAFDLETASVETLWSYGDDFVRLVGYQNGAGVTKIVTNPSVVTESATAGGTLVGHNIYGFDLLALARYHGLDIDTVSAVDTKLLAFLADPPPAKLNEGQVERYYSLDSVGERLLEHRKHGDLKALAKEFGGYDRIPVTDERYLEYLRGDVEITAALAGLLPMTPYAEREHRIARIAARISINGFLVDEDLLATRIAAGASVRSEMLARLAEYGLPLTKKDGKECKSPHATEAGREAIVSAFSDLGVTLPLTPKGKPSLSQPTMTEVAAVHPGAADLAETVKSLNGVRTVYETVATHTTGGRVHPMINLRQATGRWSVTAPGLTVMGKRGGRHVEREVLLPDPGELLIAADLAQIDARAIAALSQDRAYLELFEPGIDVHREIARRVWGDESRREDAKAVGHGWNYGLGIPGLCRNAGVSEEVAYEFDQSMRRQFPDLVAWRAEVRSMAAAGEQLDNGFGRKMRADPERAYTQGPALLGQGCARDLLMEGLLRLPGQVLPMLRAVIHDEVVLSVPADVIGDVERAVVEALSFEWRPAGAGHPVMVVAGLVGRGRNWGAVYQKEVR